MRICCSLCIFLFLGLASGVWQSGIKGSGVSPLYCFLFSRNLLYLEYTGYPLSLVLARLRPSCPCLLSLPGPGPLVLDLVPTSASVPTRRSAPGRPAARARLRALTAA